MPVRSQQRELAASPRLARVPLCIAIESLGDDVGPRGHVEDQLPHTVRACDGMLSGLRSREMRQQFCDG